MQSMKTQLDLNGSWQFTLDQQNSDLDDVLPKTFPRNEWLEARVPGTVHTDLLAHGLIDDPFYADNERRVEWVAHVAWCYRKRFHLDDAFLAHPVVHLVAEGLDTFAGIYLNGKHLASTQNMFVTHRLDVTSWLVPGENELRIRFDSAVRRARRLEAEHGRLCDTLAPERLYVRKAQYSFGWDWGPALPTCGIWRPIYLEAFDAVRLKDVGVTATPDEDLRAASVQVRVEVERFGDQAGEVVAIVELGEEQHEVPLEGSSAVTEFRLSRPKLWWPNGLGEPHLYDLNVRLLVDGREQDRAVKRFGVRKLELVREQDAWGESFRFEVNHVPLFCKGANWIPADSFLPRVTPETYRSLLLKARDAHMNMIRVWGGGIYEQELFYDLCDELGLLVWQDFMFACGVYPERTDFEENVAHEIEQVVRRLRPHPCLAIWCGNNENEWLWTQATGRSYREMPGFRLFHELIPAICQRLDPTRPYWPSSPFGGDDPNSQEQGNRHQWHIWSGWQDFTTVERDFGRFISEFGFQAPANSSTLAAAIPAEARHPQSELVEFHNKQVEGQERLFRFLAGHVKMPVSFEDFVYKCQVVQAEALRTCLEHWRRNQFRTAGSLIWQLNDCWPVSSWALVDSALRPKLAYFAVKRAFAPRLVTFVRHGDRLEVWVVNDTLDAVAGRLEMQGRTFDGAAFFSKAESVTVAPNISAKAIEVRLRELGTFDPAVCYLHAELRDETGRAVAENRYFFKRFKHLRLEPVAFTQTLEKLGAGLYQLTLQAPKFAKAVYLESVHPVQFSDNGFDLDPGRKRRVSLTAGETVALTEQSVSVRTLF